MWEESLICVLLFFGTYLIVKNYTKKNSIGVAALLLLIFTIGLFAIKWLKQEKKEPFTPGSTCGPDLSGNTKQCTQDKPFCLITERMIENDTVDQTLVFSTYGRYVSIFPDADGTVLVNLSQVVVNGTNNKNIGLNKTVTAPCDTGATNHATQAASTVNGTLTQRSWPDIWRATTTNKNTAVWQIDLGSVQMITTIRYIGQRGSTPGSSKGIRIRVYRDVTNTKEKPTRGTCIAMPTPVYPAGTTEIEQRAIKTAILNGVDPSIALRVFRGIKQSTTTPLTMYDLSDEEAAAAYMRLAASNDMLARRNGTISDSEYFKRANAMKAVTTIRNLPFVASDILRNFMNANKNDYVVPRNMNIMSTDANGNYTVDTSQGTGITKITDNGEYAATTEILSVLAPRSVDPSNTATQGIAPGTTTASSTITRDLNAEPTQVSNTWSTGAFSNVRTQATGIQIPTNEVITVNDTWTDAEIEAALKGRGSANTRKTDYSSDMNSGASTFLTNKGYKAPNRNADTLSRTIPGAGTTTGPLKEVFWIGPTATTGYSNMSSANQACIDAGADGLATPAQLTEAQDSRAQWCIFGWLSDGSSAFPMQETKTGCGAIGVNPSTCGNCPSKTVIGANCFGVKPLQTAQTAYTALPFTTVNETVVWNRKDAYSKQTCGPGLVMQNCNYSGQMKTVCMNPGQNCDSSCAGPENIVNGQKVCNVGAGFPGPQEPIVASPQITQPNYLSGIANLFEMAPTRSNKITSTDTDLATVSKSILMGRMLRAAAFTTTTDQVQDVYLGQSGRWIMIFRNTSGAHLNISNVQVHDGQGGLYQLDMEGGRPDVNESGQDLVTYDAADKDAIAPVIVTPLQNTRQLKVEGSSTGTVESPLNYSIDIDTSGFDNIPPWNVSELKWIITSPNGSITHHQGKTYSFTPNMSGQYSFKVLNEGYWNTPQFNPAAVYKEWRTVETGYDEVFGIGGYNYTHNQAQSKCESYGATLASVQQLYSAWQNAGADWCSTGWLKEANAPWDGQVLGMYPNHLQKNIPGCGNGSAQVIRYMPGNNQAGANCYGVKPREGRYSDVLPFSGGSMSGPVAGAVWNSPSPANPDNVKSVAQYVIGGPSKTTPGTTVSYSFVSSDGTSGDNVKWTITDPNNNKTTQTGSTCSFTPNSNGDYKISANPNTRIKGSSTNTVRSIRHTGSITDMTLTGPPEATINTAVSFTTNANNLIRQYEPQYLKWTIIDPNGNTIADKVTSQTLTYTFTPTVLGTYRINLTVGISPIFLENANTVINITEPATANTYKGVTATVGYLMQMTGPVEGTINKPMNFTSAFPVAVAQGKNIDTSRIIWKLTDPNNKTTELIGQRNYTFTPTLVGTHRIKLEFGPGTLIFYDTTFNGQILNDITQLENWFTEFYMYIKVTDDDGGVVSATLNVGTNDSYVPPYEFNVAVSTVKAYYQVPPYKEMGPLNVPSGMNLIINGPGHSWGVGQPKTYTASGTSVTDFRWRVIRPGAASFELQSSNSNTMTFTPYTAGMYQIQVYANSSSGCMNLDGPSCPNYNLYLRVVENTVTYKSNALNKSRAEYWMSDPKNVTNNNKLTYNAKNIFGSWPYGYQGGIDARNTSTIINNTERTSPSSRTIKDCRPDQQKDQSQGFVSLADGIWTARIKNDSTVSPYVDGVTIVFTDPEWGDMMYTCNKRNNQGVVVVVADSIDVSPEDYYLLGASVFAMNSFTRDISPFWTKSQSDKPPPDSVTANCINKAADTTADATTVALSCGLPPYSNVPYIVKKYKNFCDMTGGKYMISNNSIVLNPEWVRIQTEYANNISLGAQVKLALDNMNAAVKKVTDANDLVNGKISEYNTYAGMIYGQCPLPSGYSLGSLDFFPSYQDVSPDKGHYSNTGQWMQQYDVTTTNLAGVQTKSGVGGHWIAKPESGLVKKDGTKWTSATWPAFGPGFTAPPPKPSYWDGMSSFYECVRNNTIINTFTSEYGDSSLRAIRNKVTEYREAVKPFLEPQNTAYQAYVTLVNRQITQGPSNGGIDKTTGENNIAAALASLGKEIPLKTPSPDLTPVLMAKALASIGMFGGGFGLDKTIHLPL